MPTEIWTVADLENMKENYSWTADSHFIQMADIDMAGVDWGTDYWALWESSYNGNGYTVENINSYLFAGVWESNIYNLTVRGNIAIDQGGAGFALEILDSSTVENCRFEGDIVTVQHSGGFVQDIRASIVRKCSFHGNISFNDGFDPSYITLYSVGGFVEKAQDNCLIEECYTTGTIASDGNLMGEVGGFIAEARLCEIKNCYSRIDLIDNIDPLSYSLGGFVGYAIETCTFTNCYSTGIVALGSVDIGGFCGEELISGGESPTFTNCYYDTETSGQSDTGKGEPRLTAQMVYPYTDKHVSGTYVDWEFENKHITDLTDFDFVFGEPWKHDPTFTLNDGYPQFEGGGPVVPILTKLSDCHTPTNPLFSISLDYGPFNNTVIERQDPMIAQYRFTNPPTGLTLKTKWRYLTPKLEHNVVCGFEVRGILIRYKLKGKKPKLIPEFE